MKQVLKRDGQKVKFNLKKIVSAIRRAGESTGEFGYDESLELTNDVVQAFDGKDEASVEEIQDKVEDVLSDAGYKKTAKAYILYREQHNNLRNDNAVLIDAVKSIDDYLDRSDWRVNANANQGYSLGGMILNTSGKVTANYWLSHVYPKEAGEAHRNGDIQIHDLDMLSSYCTGWSLRSLLQEGFNGVPGKVESNPPKHLGSALGQMVNFWGCLQNENAGAQAFSSFDTYLAPYVRNDKLTYQQVYDAIQEFVFNVNVPSRWGCVPKTTKVLSEDGWKSIDELSEEDIIYTWKNGSLNKCKVNGVCRKPYKGSLISFRNDHYRYNQTVTTTHRTLVAKTNKSVFDAEIVHAEDIAKEKSNKYWKFPTAFNDVSINKDCDLTDDEIMLAAMIYTDGSLDFRKGVIHKVKYFKSERRLKELDSLGISPDSIFKNVGLEYSKTEKVSSAFGSKMFHWVFYGDFAKKISNLVGLKSEISDKFYKMSKRQAELFLKVWSLHDGDEKRKLLQVDNDVIFEQLSHIALLAGYVSSKKLRECKSGGITTYVSLTCVDGISPKTIEFIDYDGDVWCPNVEDGTAIFMNDDGGVFISGQTQTPFTNLTFDLVCPEDLKDSQPIIDGEEMDYTYSELQTEMDMINKAFMEVMMKGDAKGRLFTFPIPTYNITPDFQWNTEISDLLFEMTAKYGLPYFQNFLNSDLKVGDVRSMCCRLQLDLREIRKRGGGLFGSGEQTGSVGVITINCARLGYLYKNDITGMYKQLDHWLHVAKDALEQKRKALIRWMEQGLYPYSKRYLGRYDTLFSTIGINGVNEMIRNFTNDEHDITDDYGQKFAINLMDHIREKLVEFQVETGNLYNLEATPAEGCFAYDTEVMTTEGVKKIGEIVGREDLGVLSYNEKKHKREFRKATCIHQTGVKKVLKVTFDNGQELICTPNHPFGVRSWNGKKGEYVKYVEAQDLKEGMRVKSAYKEYHGDFDNGRQYVVFGHSDYLHRMIWEYYNAKDIPEGYVVHHKDFNRDNNDISNLELMSSTDHKSLHLSLRHQEGDTSIKMLSGENNPFYGKTHSEETKERISKNRKGKCIGDSNYCRTEEGRKRMSEIAKAKAPEQHSKYEHSADTNVIINLFMKGKSVAEIAKELGGVYTYSLCKGRLQKAGLLQNNHIVKAVEQLDIEIPVYNMEVEENHNYFVGGEKGVLVHNCTYRFAKEDKKRYPDVLQAGKPDAPYYTNSTQLPVGYTDDPFTALDLQENLQKRYSGGTVLHLYMGERVSSGDMCKLLVRRVLENYRVPYITITPTFSICPKHGYISGEHKYCPICDEELMNLKQKQCESCND